MSKIAICIGVNNVNNFARLKGATLGAIEFSKWASAHGYQTKLFIDEEGNVVRVREIYDFIKGCLEEMVYDQIIVYFSGHGISRGPNQEFWYLSEGGENDNEIIGLTRSADDARNCQIRYVLFISDACRSLPTDYYQPTSGQTIFAKQKVDTNNTIDIFYATRPGAPAYEIAGDNLKDAHGIFTESLIEYLSGEVPETVVNNDIDDGTEIKRYLSKYYDPVKLSADINYKSLREENQKWIISAPEVDLKLREYVESRAFGVTQGQSPEIRVQNHKTEYPLATFTDLEGKNLMLKNWIVSKPEVQPADPGMFKVNVLKDVKDLSINLWNNKSDQNNLATQVENVAEKNVFASDKLFRDPVYEHYTGMELIGETMIDFITPAYAGNMPWRYRNANSISFHHEQPYRYSRYGLLLLENGRSIPVAVIEGFVAQLIFKDGYLFTINYTPVKSNSYNYLQYQEKKEMIIQKRNLVAIAANNGFNYEDAFKKIDFAKLGYDDAGSFLRYGKALDPSLGLYAAYAFRETGNFEKIGSVYDYMILDNPVVPFDVAMLAGKLDETSIASFCPVMSSGWAYRDLYEKFISEDILEATKYLEPGLWTTFSAKGTEILIKLINDNHRKPKK
ncbi:caspase family protein [Chryseobacterium sp.]|uniref:caspase family protein n=1 Tax=Chryseobacterium sp. TaxID=1871047 RepID=UPI0031DC2A2A